VPQFDTVVPGMALVRLPDDQAVVSEDDARATAEPNRVWLHGDESLTHPFESATLVRAQPLDSAGRPSGEPGPLHWMFVVHETFAGDPVLSTCGAGASPTCHVKSPGEASHALIVGVDATTGMQDGMFVT
jgi:hypothetical protein